MDALAPIVADYTEHAKLSPSGAKGWMACAGKVVLEASIPNTSSQASDDGTAIHYVGAKLLTKPVAVSDETYVQGWVGTQVAVNYQAEPLRTVLFTEDMAEMAVGYAQTIRGIANGREIMVEQRVGFSYFINIPEQFGTLDAGIWFQDAGEIFVGDLKSGYRPVEPDANPQLMIYALGFLYKLWQEDVTSAAANPWDYAYEQGIKTARLAIYQPRHRGLVEWTCSLVELNAFAQVLKAKAARTEEAATAHSFGLPDWARNYLNPNPNDDECAFCRALPTCPAAQAKVQEVVGADFKDITSESAPVANLTDADLAAAMGAAPFAEAFFTAVRAEVERRLLAGTPVEGFGLELGRKGPRQFRDEAEVTELVRNKWRIPIVDAYNLKLKSPTQMEKLTKPGKEVDELSGLVVETPPVIGPRRWAALCEMVTQADPKPSVKPASAIKVPYSPAQLSAGDFTAT